MVSEIIFKIVQFENVVLRSSFQTSFKRFLRIGHSCCSFRHFLKIAQFENVVTKSSFLTSSKSFLHLAWSCGIFGHFLKFPSLRIRSSFLIYFKSFLYISQLYGILSPFLRFPNLSICYISSSFQIRSNDFPTSSKESPVVSLFIFPHMSYAKVFFPN